MSIGGNLNARYAMLQEWKKTQFYKAMCLQQQQKCDLLLERGRHYLKDLNNISSVAKTKAVRFEYAIKGSVHRAVYCPSPVLDLLVGNVRRGRILDRVTAASKITHRFGFDKNNQLQFVEVISDIDRQIAYTEYITREKNKLFGITIDNAGHLSALSEEQFVDGRIQKYIYAEMLPATEDILCFDLNTEEYQYDEHGLASCEWTGFDPLSSDMRRKLLCKFERRDGLLYSYTTQDLIWMQIDPENTPTHMYVARISRKA